ncbi:MAG: HNH endonuclease [Gammaproteobacteria bacterium]|nr:HNH endonuclease [Gammaproteobacteria bacterium]
MSDDDRDTLMRMAAFDRVRSLNAVHGYLSANQLRSKFVFAGEAISLVDPRKGIWKPKEMCYLLSIRTVFPKSKIWYDDQREVHRQIYAGEEMVDYAFMDGGPEAAQNRWLRQAYQNQIPIIYFLGIAPSQYLAIFPSFIVGWDAGTLKARVGFGVPEQMVLVPSEQELPTPPSPHERCYALRIVKQRLHQASFREAVIAAYKGRCAISGLPEQQLLDAAHIISDNDERLGQPIIPNGLPLSKLHHAAFDAHLIGIDPDYRIHVSNRLLSQNDGPMLEALKHQNGAEICLPHRSKDQPDRDRLARRYEHFRAVV